MILTVTLNPALDRVVEIAGFRPGKVNLLRRERASIAGGKGINVSRVVKTLGEKTLATGWLGGEKGKIIKEKLDREKIYSDFVSIKEESRANLTILDSLNGKETHLVEEGPRISYPEIKNLEEKLRNLVGRAKVVVFSGSIPGGVKEDIYNSLIRLVSSQKSNIITILDTRGQPLRKGLKAKPFMVKPNEEEIETLAGHYLRSRKQLVEVAQFLAKSCARLVVISRGNKEILVVREGKVLIFTPPTVESLNTVGAGDALVAGFAVGLSRSMSLEEMASLGVAAGAASAEKGRERALSLERIQKLAKNVRCREYSAEMRK